MRYYYQNRSTEEKEDPDKGYVRWLPHKCYYLCTLFEKDNRGLAVVRPIFDEVEKTITFTALEDSLANDICNQPDFDEYFAEHADYQDADGCYPTIGVRKIMWALRMKPLKKEEWEQFLQTL